MATSRPDAGRKRAYLRRLTVKRVDLVPAGANQESRIVLAKARPKGMAEGFVPITSPAELKAAISALAQSSNPEKAKARIIAEAKKLGLTKELPSSWEIGGDDKPNAMPKPKPGAKPGAKPPFGALAGAASAARPGGKKPVGNLNAPGPRPSAADAGRPPKPIGRPAKPIGRPGGQFSTTNQPRTRKEHTDMPEHDDIDTVEDEGRPLTLAEQIAALSDEEQDGVTAYVEALAAELAAERERAEAALAALAKGEAEVEEDPNEMLKSLAPEVAARIVKAERDAAEATAKAEAIEKRERERVFKDRASALATLSGGEGEGVDRLGAILDKAEAALDEADYAELERTLVAADTQAQKAVLFGSRGGDGEAVGGGEFVDTVKARADVLTKEGLDPFDALVQARRENADMASQYHDDVARGSRG